MLTWLRAAGLGGGGREERAEGGGEGEVSVTVGKDRNCGDKVVSARSYRKE